MSRASVGRRGLSENITVESKTEDPHIVICQQCGSAETFWDAADGWCCVACGSCDSDE